MKVIISIGHLKKAVGIIAPAVLSNQIIKSTECAKISISGGSAWIESSGLETTIRTKVPCESSQDFTFLFPFEDLKGLVNNLPDGVIEISYNDEKLSISANTPLGKKSLQTVAVKDFPKLPQGEQTQDIEIKESDIEKIKTAISLSFYNKFCAHMHGVYFDINENALNVVTTNDRVLFKSAYIEIDCPKKIQAFLSVKSAKNSFLSTKGDVKINFIGAHYIKTRDESTEIYCRLVDQAYPNYNSIIPNYSQSFTVDKSELISAINFSLLSANKDTKQLVFSLEGDSLSISSNNADNSKNSTTEPIGVLNNQAGDFSFALSGEFLSSIVSHLGDKIIFRTAGTPDAAFILDSESTADTFMLMTQDFQTN